MTLQRVNNTITVTTASVQWEYLESCDLITFCHLQLSLESWLAYIMQQCCVGFIDIFASEYDEDIPVHFIMKIGRPEFFWKKIFIVVQSASLVEEIVEIGRTC